MRSDTAVETFDQGYNCAQAVFGAYAQEYGLDQETAMRLSASLGGGLAHTGEVCGALLGACLALGLARGAADVPDAAEKARHNERVRALVDGFREKFGYSDCADLQVMGNRTNCVQYVRFAAELLEKVLKA